MSDVFMSYSRRNTDFVREVVNHLLKEGRDVWVDWEDIARASDWLTAIYEGIEAADSFVCIISKHWLESEICHYELARARMYNKRVIPCIYEPITNDIKDALFASWEDKEWKKIAHENWAFISHLNWIFFDKHDNYANEFAALITALDQDLEHMKAHTRYLVRAREWDHKGELVDMLLFGREIEEAEAWLKDSNGKTPKPTEQQRLYIQKSREVEDDRNRYLNRLKQGVRVFALMGIIAMFAVLAALYQVSVARTEVDEARQEVFFAQATLTPIAQQIADLSEEIAVSQLLILQAELSNEATTLLQSNGNPEIAALLAIQALKIGYNTLADASLVKSLEMLETERIFRGHTDWVRFVSASPDGKYFASAGVDRTAKLWDAQTGDIIRTYSGHEDRVQSANFSPDGTRLATASNDQTVRIWEVATGEELLKINAHDIEARSVNFSPDGKSLVTGGGDHLIKVWDAETGELIRTLTGHTNIVTSVRFSPNGRYIASGSGDGTVRLWLASTGRQLRVSQGKTDWVNKVRFDESGEELVVATYNGIVKILDVADFSVLAQLEAGKGSANDAAISPRTGDVLIAFEDSTIGLWVTEHPVLARVYAGHESAINSIAFTPDGAFIASASNDNFMRLWHVGQLHTPNVYRAHKGFVSSSIISTDGEVFVTGGEDGVVLVWKPHVYRPILSIKTVSNVYTVTIDKAAARVISGHADGIIRIWSLTDGALLKELKGHTDWVMRVRLTADETKLLSASGDRTMRLWDIETGETIQTFTGHTDWVNEAVFNPDETLIASGGDDRTIRLWDVATGEQLNLLAGHDDWVNTLLFMPDGKTLLSGSRDRTVRLWDVATGEEAWRITDHTGAVLSLAMSSDQAFIASAAADATIRLWHIETGELVRVFIGHQGAVRSVMFTADGTQLLTSSEDRTTRLWDIDYHALIDQVCDRIFRIDFTPLERLRYQIPDDAPTCEL